MKTWMSGLLTGVCLMFWFIILVGCVKPVEEDWARRCMDKTGDEFHKCAKEWGIWQSRQVEGR